jgi:hypothetical protein
MSVGKSADAENIFSIYPNPSENEIHIGLYTSKEEDVTIEIYNSLMQKTAVIYEGRLQKNNCDFSFSADDHNLTPAVYFCKLNIGSKTIVKQFIITR